MDSPARDALLELAREAARVGARALLDRRGEPSGVDTKSASGDFVSDADRASEQAITELLLSARPSDGLLGEEGATQEAASGVRWVVDPLDGTTNYLYGLAGWGVSVAAEQHGGDGWRPIVGAVLDPLSGELFRAAEGRGAWLGDHQLRVNDPVALDRALVGTGFFYDPAVREHQGRVAAAVLPRVRDLRRVGAAALDLCWVAAGRLDGFFESHLEPWDMAAGTLIAMEAGAVVTPYHRGVTAAGETLHSALVELLAEAGRAADAS